MNNTNTVVNAINSITVDQTKQAVEGIILGMWAGLAIVIIVIGVIIFSLDRIFRNEIKKASKK